MTTPITAAAPSGTSECSCSALRSLADTLEMWANMLREHCDDPENGLPSPCLIDEWLSDYRDEWAAQNPTENRTGHLVDGTVPPVVLPLDSDNQSERK